MNEYRHNTNCPIYEGRECTCGRILARRETEPHVTIHPTAIVYPGVTLGLGAVVSPYAIVGNPSGFPRVRIGMHSFIGNYALIRGQVTTGRCFKLGSHASVEGTVTIGDDTTVRGKCEIPSSTIGHRVQIYARNMFYDTPNLLNGDLVPPVIEDDVTLACDVRVLGGCTVGKGSFVCAGAFVTENIPPGSYVKRDGSWTPLR